MHKYFRIAAFFASFALLVSSCGREDATQEELPLGFSTSVAETRAGELTTANLTTMGVLAYFTKGGSFNTATSTPDFMYNQKVDKSSGTWKYDPVKFWPANTADKISFFAYAPHSSEITANGDEVTVFSSTLAGYPKLTYYNKTGQTDLLVAAPLMNKNSANGDVKFAFRHALTKLVFKVKGGNTYTKEIVSLTLVMYAGRALLTYNSSGSTWSNFSGGKTTYTVATNQTIGVADTDKTIGTLFMLPIGTPRGDEIVTCFNLEYKVKTTGGTVLTTESLIEQKFPATPTWDMGGMVTYTLDLSEGVTVTASSGVDWELGNKEDITVTPS